MFWDVRYALRWLRRSPWFAATLVLTLAVGIAATTTIFSLINSVLLRPLPYRDPAQLVRLYTNLKKVNNPRFWFSPREYLDLQRSCRTCSGIAAWTFGSASLSMGDRPVRVRAAWATHELLPLLGVRPALGRWYDASEDRPGEPAVIVIAHGLWQREFGGDPAIIGKKISLNATPVTVIGVMPPGFDFLDGQEAWVPLGLDLASDPPGHFLDVVARVAPGSEVGVLREELAALAVSFAEAAGAGEHSINPDRHPMVALPLQADLVGSLVTTLWLLQGAALLVLLISVVNIASLLLARAESRRREISIRVALGASHHRLARQFLTESLVLGGLGGGLGLVFSAVMVSGLGAVIPPSVPRASELAFDAAAAGVALVCAVVSALAFGLAPLIHARKLDVYSQLKDGARTTGSRAAVRIRRAMVISQVALAVVLLFGCVVIVRSYLGLRRVDLGIEPRGALTFGIELPAKRYPGITGDAFWHRLADRMRALPGAASVGLITDLPPRREVETHNIYFPDRTLDREGSWNVNYWQVISEDALDALGARLVKGRAIARSDIDSAPRVVLVNEAFAVRFLAGKDPIGQRVQLPYDHKVARPREEVVVGVVADIKQDGAEHPVEPEVFIPLWQRASLDEPATSQSTVWTVIRTRGNPAELAPAVHRAIAEIDPTLPVFGLRPLEDVFGETLARPRFLALLLTAFAAIALALAAVGLYSVMAHIVVDRTHEISLRLVLGAQPGQVRRMVLRQAASLLGGGVALGVSVIAVASQLLASSLEHLLYTADLFQPLALIGIIVVVVVVGLIATWLPAQRATRIEPNTALRSE